MLVGDAFSTSCPAAGTGARKVLVDVERLYNAYIPRWLATPGMGETKVAAFYDDPVKQACDAFSARKAFQLRSLSIDLTPGWTALRCARFAAHWSRGALRRLTPTPASSPTSRHDELRDDAPTWVQSTPAHK